MVPRRCRFRICQRCAVCIFFRPWVLMSSANRVLFRSDLPLDTETVKMPNIMGLIHSGNLGGGGGVGLCYTEVSLWCPWQTASTRVSKKFNNTQTKGQRPPGTGFPSTILGGHTYSKRQSLKIGGVGGWMVLSETKGQGPKI